MPVLTETPTEPEVDPLPARPVAQESTSRVPAKKKVKRAPPPRVEIRTEDVYAMIEAALARIVARSTSAVPTHASELRRPDDNDLVRLR